MKKKFYIICSFIILLLILVIFITMHLLKSRSTHSLASVKQLLNNPVKSSNILVTGNTIENNNITTYSIYLKDGKEYAYFKNSSNETISETFWDITKKEKIIVLNSYQKIIYSQSPDTDYMISGNKDFNEFLTLSNDIEYKYLGKTYINNLECIKVGLTLYYGNTITKKVYYIVPSEGNIIKCETYEGNNKNSLTKTKEENYNYQYNIVTDADIKNFDINNYSGYSEDIG